MVRRVKISRENLEPDSAKQKGLVDGTDITRSEPVTQRSALHPDSESSLLRMVPLAECPNAGFRAGNLIFKGALSVIPPCWTS
jgi:hypothetical protein